MTSRISLKAAAKINLYLEITGNRVDGYHDLVMILQSIDLCDRDHDLSTSSALRYPSIGPSEGLDAQRSMWFAHDTHRVFKRWIFVSFAIL